MALLTGFGYNAKTIDSELITMVVEDMSLDDHED
jgi:hypothetical protein